MKSKHLLHLLMMALLVPGIVNAQQLPADGPKSSRAVFTFNENYYQSAVDYSYYVPFTDFYNTEGTASQFIIPATDLNVLAGGVVNKLTFYSETLAKNFGATTQFKVYMAEVPYVEIMSPTFVDWSLMTEVYEGALSISNYRMEIELDQDFFYAGDNLMIGFDVISPIVNIGTGDTKWCGSPKGINNAVYSFTLPEGQHIINDNERTYDFAPKLTFNYTPATYPRVYPVNVNLDGTTAQFSWTSPDPQVTGYAYQIKEASSSTWSEWTNTTSTSVVIDDLELNTEYEFRVKALYGSNESVPTKVSFQTDCPTFMNVPYNENFDSYVPDEVKLVPEVHILPNCWDYINESNDAINSVFPTIQGYFQRRYNTYPYSNSVKNSLMFYIANGTANDADPQYAILPAMHSIRILHMSFNARGYDSNPSTFVIGVMEGTDVSTFTPVATITPSTTAFESFSVDFSNYQGNGNRIAFMMNVPASGLTGRVYIDDISIVEVPVPFTKHIDSWETPNFGGWYLISSPLAGETNPADVQNMLNNTNPEDFDLYRFEQNTIYFDEQQHGLEWENWKANNYNLEPLRGYLYANRNTVDLVFSGEPYNGDGKVVLKRTEDVEFTGWNLIGNPWNSYASIGRAYYRINSAGNEVFPGTDNIPAMEAVFVIAATNGEEVTFTPTDAPTPREAMNMALNLSYNGGKVIDRTILNFGEGSTLQKFQLNPANTKVYIPQDGKDYAVVRAEGQGELPVNFRAAENGSYTLSFSKENVDFNYLHLIDNMTSDDIDLLSTPSYTFNAKTTDYEYRFKLVYASSNDNESFGFVDEGSNFNVYGIDGEATLQMIDMMGRVLSTETFSGSIEKKIDNAGVYMFRLINGDNVKIQKVVVK